MNDNLIHFAVFQAVTFSITGSLALYMALQFIGYCISTFDTIDEGDTLRPARR